MCVLAMNRAAPRAPRCSALLLLAGVSFAAVAGAALPMEASSFAAAAEGAFATGEPGASSSMRQDPPGDPAALHGTTLLMLILVPLGFIPPRKGETIPAAAARMLVTNSSPTKADESSLSPERRRNNNDEYLTQAEASTASHAATARSAPCHTCPSHHRRRQGADASGTGGPRLTGPTSSRPLSQAMSPPPVSAWTSSRDAL